MNNTNKKQTAVETEQLTPSQTSHSQPTVDVSRRNMLRNAAAAAAAGATLMSGTAMAGGMRGLNRNDVNDHIDNFCEQRNRPFEGQTAFITGGARGIGRGVAELLAENGANIVIYDVAQQIETVKYPLANQNDLSDTQAAVEAQGVGCIAIQGDVRDRAQLAAAMETAVNTFGSLDFVMANAGITQFGTLDSFSDSEVDTVVDVNLGGVIKTIQAATPILREQQFGRIILTSSVTGRGGASTFPVYSATKWGVIGLAKATAQALGAFNITCNAICPDIVHTPLLDNDYILGAFGVPDFATFEGMVQEAHPLPIGAFQPRDVAKTVKYLCSEDAKYVTAEVFDISAGASAGHMA